MPFGRDATCSHGEPWGSCPHGCVQPDDRDETASLLGDLRNGRWLDAQTFPALTYAVPGVLPEGSSLLVGPPKIGKSWCVLGFALAVAVGGRTLGGIKVDARPVLYLALEDGDRRLQDRCRKLMGTGVPIPGFDYITRAMPGAILPTINAWLERHSGAAPLVILDTLGKVMPPALNGESSYARDYRIGSALKRLTDERPGMSLLVNHHDRKAGAEDFVDNVSGTHGLAGAADTIIVLTRDRNDTAGLLRVTGRDVAEGEYAVNFIDGCTWTLNGGGLAEAAKRAAQSRAAAGLGDRSAELLAYVSKHPDGVRSGEIAEQLKMPDARRYLARFVESGRLVRLGRGLYAPPQPPVPTVPLSHPEGPDWDNGTVGTGVEGGRLPYDVPGDDRVTTFGPLNPNSPRTSDEWAGPEPEPPDDDNPPPPEEED